MSELPSVWQDDHGTSTQISQFSGKTVLLTMAYSTCREVCSFTLHRLEELQQSADRLKTPIEVVVISYDPYVDNPASWTIYRRHHHLTRDNWHFLTGSTADTRRFANALQFPYWRYDEHLVHDFKILLVGPEGQISQTLTWANRNVDVFASQTPPCRASNSQGCNL